MNAAHLDDEALSAHLDGEPSGDVAAHLETCRVCQARLGELRSAALEVAAPVPPPSPDERNRAVAAALDAWPEGPAPAEVTPLAPRFRPPAWGVAAAVAAVALVAVGVVATVTDRGAGTAASPPSGADRAAGPVGAEAPAADGGDLGEQSDPAVLARTVQAALGPPAARAAAPPEGAPAGPTAEAFADRGQPAATSRPSAPPCTAEARGTLRDLGPLVYTATLRWEGTPAVALVYRTAPTGSNAPARLAHQVLVMAPGEGCRLLVAQLL